MCQRSTRRRSLSSDKSGSINTKELQNIIKSLRENLTDKQIDKIIREADKDGNWTVNYKGSFLFQ